MVGSLVLLAVAAGCGGARKAPAAAGDPGACEPGRCMDDIAQRLDDHRPEARACYEAGHARDPSLAGLLVINFEIDRDGAVVDASQSVRDEQLTDTDVVNCVTGVIRQIKFAPSARGKSTRAFHRYEFSP